MRVLVTGGIKSGKSSHATELAGQWSGEKYFLATAVALDEEMKEKIIRHQEERGSDYITIEEPVAINESVRNNMVVDCITMWMNNLFYQGMEDRWENILRDFLERIGDNLIIVSNETGLGNVPMDSMARRYNIYLGMANKLIGAAVDRVYLMISGIPLQVK